MDPILLYRCLHLFIIRKRKRKDNNHGSLIVLHSPHYIRAYLHSCWVNLSENIILIEWCSVIAINFYLSRLNLNPLSIAYSVIMLIDSVNISNLLAGVIVLLAEGGAKGTLGEERVFSWF